MLITFTKVPSSETITREQVLALRGYTAGMPGNEDMDAIMAACKEALTQPFPGDADFKQEEMLRSTLGARGDCARAITGLGLLLIGAS